MDHGQVSYTIHDARLTIHEVHLTQLMQPIFAPAKERLAEPFGRSEDGYQGGISRNFPLGKFHLADASADAKFAPCYIKLSTNDRYAAVLKAIMASVYCL